MGGVTSPRPLPHMPMMTEIDYHEMDKYTQRIIAGLSTSFMIFKKKLIVSAADTQHLIMFIDTLM